MKLVINIPCFNEENTLPLVLKEIPKKITGIKSIEVQIVDDGSTDRTCEIAKKYNCRVIKHKHNCGLGIAFKTGMEAALENGADIFVNTDADNQYPCSYIADLIKPVMENNADLVIGDRQTWSVHHFSFLKKILQWVGSYFVRLLTQTEVPDTVSGFRAYSRDAMLRLNVTTKFSYVLDTIMQCRRKNLRILSVPIQINSPTRPSRLFKNMFQHIRKSGFNLIRLYVIYKPLPTFILASFITFIPAGILIIRFMYYFLTVDGRGHIQSLIASAIIINVCVMLIALGIIGEIIGVSRILTEEHLYFQKKQYYAEKIKKG